jgi:small basic protein
VAPSIDLSRERSVWAILRSTLSLYRDYPWLFLLLALAVIAPWDLIKLGITGAGPFGHLNHTSFLGRQSLDLLNVSFIDPLVSALHIHAVVAIGKGQRPRLAAVARSGVRVLPTVGIAALAAGVAIPIGFLALVIPGLILWIRLSVVAQTAAVEQGGVRAALRRSWRLTRFDQGHIFGLLLVVGVLVSGSSLGGYALGSGSGSNAGALALGVAINTIVASFTALTTALLYFDLQARELSPRHPREHQYARDLDPASDP